MALILDYATPRPASPASRAAGKGIGILLSAIGLAVFLVSVVELRIGCHEAINWALDGNHGNGFGLRFFVRFALSLILSAALLLLAWIANPEAFGSDHGPAGDGVRPR